MPTKPQPVKRVGLALEYLNRWPEPLRPTGYIAWGDDLTLGLMDGSSPTTVTIFCGSIESHLAEGAVFSLIQKLYRTDDIDCFLDRYDVCVARERDTVPAAVYVQHHRHTDPAFSVLALYTFAQAILDYACGKEDYNGQIERLKATIHAIESERDGKAVRA